MSSQLNTYSIPRPDSPEILTRLVLRGWVYTEADDCFVAMTRTDCAKRGSKSCPSLFVAGK